MLILDILASSPWRCRLHWFIRFFFFFLSFVTYWVRKAEEINWNEMKSLQVAKNSAWSLGILSFDWNTCVVDLATFAWKLVVVWSLVGVLSSCQVYFLFPSLDERTSYGKILLGLNCNSLRFVKQPLRTWFPVDHVFIQVDYIVFSFNTYQAQWGLGLWDYFM